MQRLIDPLTQHHFQRMLNQIRPPKIHETIGKTFYNLLVAVQLRQEHSAGVASDELIVGLDDDFTRNKVWKFEAILSTLCFASLR